MEESLTRNIDVLPRIKKQYLTWMFVVLFLNGPLGAKFWVIYLCLGWKDL
jgi:hypothetical protein